MKRLILFRHADAQPPKEDMDDSLRVLTAQGEKSIRMIEHAFSNILRSYESVAIITSEYKRAIQTGEMLAAMIDSSITATASCIQDGDLDALMRIVDTYSQDTIVVVGHQPYLSDFAFELAGVSIPFEKAAAASFLLGSEYVRFEWYVTSELLTRV